MIGRYAGAIAGLVLLGCGGLPGNSPETYFEFGGRVFDRFERVQGGEKVTDKQDGVVYRLKNHFGWDLKGADGIYGPEYMNKKGVHAENLLKQQRPTVLLKRRLMRGGEGLPRYGNLMPEEHVGAAANFINAMRDGLIPRSDDIWTLSKGTPNNYKLVPGANAAQGHKNFAARCAGCHGADGTKRALDGKYSLGAFNRAKGYEAWFKILAGHPGSWMKGQGPPKLTRHQAAAFIRDTMAALCDRTRYPAKGGVDVPDGDPRCGAYLK